MSEELELKPCPFCGGCRIKAHYIRDGRSLSCQDCSASVHTFNGRQDITERLIEMWNRRTPPPLSRTITEG